ncbi:MAG: hypothetical protein ACJ789_17695 [Thermomicrobiales bacterium]
MDESKIVNDAKKSTFSTPASGGEVDSIAETMRIRHGEEWGNDDESNIQFALDAAASLRRIDGAHLIGDPDMKDGKMTLTFWVDFPLDDLMAVDQLAFDIFSRFSDELFFSERRLEAKAIRYAFLTGSPRQGHIGSLVLAGSYAADFVDRERVRSTGSASFHA